MFFRMQNSMQITILSSNLIQLNGIDKLWTFEGERSKWPKRLTKIPGKHFFATIFLKWSNEPVFRFYQKNQVSCPVQFGLGNPKMVSDLKSDLVMTSSQRRPNVHLIGNPAVLKTLFFYIFFNSLNLFLARSLIHYQSP